MPQKNYYQLLQVSPQATAQEIKAAYRKLAFKYHPDRNKGNTLTEAVLKEINEAYSVLSNSDKRKFYNASIALNDSHFKQQRPAPVTSQTILQQAIKLRIFVEKSNVLSINQDLVFHKVQTLLSAHYINLLLVESNRLLIQQFVQQVLLCMQPLTAQNIQYFLPLLEKLAAGNDVARQEIHSFYKEKKNEAFWQRYKMLVVLIISLLLCLLMYLL